MQIRSLGQEDPLEEGMTTHSIFLPGESLWTEKPGRLYSPQARKESDMTEATQHACTLTIQHYQFSSVAQLCPTLQPHGLQHSRLPYPSPTPRAYSDSCPFCWQCHPTILSSVIPFSSCLQSFPASGSFPVSQFFASGGQSIGVSASASVLPMNIQD